MESVFNGLSTFFESQWEFVIRSILICLSTFMLCVILTIIDKTKIKTKILVSIVVSALMALLSMAMIFIFCKITYSDDMVKTAFDSISSSVLRKNLIDIVIPLVIACFVSGISLYFKKRNISIKRRWKIFVFIIPVFLSNILLFANNITTHKLPSYPLPQETLLKMVDNQFNFQPLFLSKEYFDEIDADKYKETIPTISSLANPAPNTPTPQKQSSISIPTPIGFSDYMQGIYDEQYAEGLNVHDYILGAYTLYVKGSHNNDNYAIGYMFAEIANHWECFFKDHNVLYSSKEEFYNAALEAYQKSNKQDKTYDACNNIAIIYVSLEQNDLARKNYQQAIKYNEDISLPVDNYTDLIFKLYDTSATDTDLNTLIDDILFICQHTDNLRLSTLLGTLILHTEHRLSEGVAVLRNIDNYYTLGHPLTKIILASFDVLSGGDGSRYISQITEESLEDADLIYLARYYMSRNIYENAYGYLVDNYSDVNIESARIRLLLDFFVKGKLPKLDDKNTITINFNNILNETLNEQTLKNWTKDDYGLFQIVHYSAEYQIGKIDKLIFSQKIREIGLSDNIVQYFLAIAAFNAADYLQAIEKCDTIINSLAKEDMGVPLDEYYIRLIRAESYYRYAKTLSIFSEKKEYLDKARKECEYFNRSARTFRYIQGQFEELKKMIDIAEGKMSDILTNI